MKAINLFGLLFFPLSLIFTLGLKTGFAAESIATGSRLSPIADFSINSSTRIIPMYGTCTFQEAQAKNGNWSYWFVNSKDNSGSSHRVGWKKVASINPRLKSGRFLNLGSAVSIVDHVLYPVFEKKINPIVEFFHGEPKEDVEKYEAVTSKENLVATRRIKNIAKDKTSEAVLACEQQGLHLPTKEEYEALRNCFEPDSNGVMLSSRGFAAFRFFFPDTRAKYDKLFPSAYWTSTMEKDTDDRHAYIFDARSGSIHFGPTYDKDSWSVRCISY